MCQLKIKKIINAKYVDKQTISLETGADATNAKNYNKSWDTAWKLERIVAIEVNEGMTLFAVARTETREMIESKATEICDSKSADNTYTKKNDGQQLSLAWRMKRE